MVAGLDIPGPTDATVEVRHEDLEAAGADVLVGVLRTLGIESDVDECGRFVAACTPEALAGDTVSVPTGMKGPVEESARRKVTDGWRDELTQREIRAVEWNCRREMEHFGYVATDSRPSPLSIPLAKGQAKAVVRRGLSAASVGLDVLGGRLR